MMLHYACLTLWSLCFMSASSWLWLGAHALLSAPGLEEPATSNLEHVRRLHEFSVTARNLAAYFGVAAVLGTLGWWMQNNA